MVSQSTMTMATTFLATPLALLGWEFRPLTQAKAKKVDIIILLDFEEMCADFEGICAGVCGGG